MLSQKLQRKWRGKIEGNDCNIIMFLEIYLQIIINVLKTKN